MLCDLSERAAGRQKTQFVETGPLTPITKSALRTMRGKPRLTELLGSVEAAKTLQN
jgi:hypothetical protein